MPRISCFFLLLLFSVSTLRGEEYNGVCFPPDSGESAVSRDLIKVEIRLRQLKEKGANTACFIPLAFQKEVDQPRINFPSTLDPELEAGLAAAKRLDLKVVMKPAVWSAQFVGFSGQGAIRMTSEEDWRAWFEDYERMICRFAGAAQRLRADIFVVGTKYDKATVGRDRQWRKIIRSVRAIYKGRLSYEANGFEEAERISFWDALDVICVSLPNRAETTYTTDRGLLSRRNADKSILLVTENAIITAP